MAGPSWDEVMKVLVTWASKHGSTAEIGYAIGGELREHRIRVVMCPVENADMAEEFDAYVIGSAVYAGHWMRHAKEFLGQHRQRLLRARVWLYSNGPLGHAAGPEDAPVDAGELFEDSGPREHRIFAGKLDKSELSFPERAISAALHAPYGDFRDWDEIRGWANDIAGALQRKEVPA
jgi:menaquinone-dependent protoporphyrinogen oxidase